MELILGILGQIGFDPKAAFFIFLNFIFVYFILHKFLFSKLGAVIKERQDTIKRSIEDSQLAATKLSSAEQKAAELISDAKREANKIVENSHKEAEELKMQLEAKTRVEVGEMIKKAKAEMEKDREQMKLEIKEHAANLVINATERIIGKKLDAATDLDLTKQIVSEISQ